jgi:hypothetical protein
MSELINMSELKEESINRSFSSVINESNNKKTKVTFNIIKSNNNYVTEPDNESDDEQDNESNNELDNESNDEPDFEPYDESDNENNNLDHNDILDSDEQEINEYSDNTDEDLIYSKLDKEPNGKVIMYIYNSFLLKHEHLDNYKNRNIIFELCKMAVNNMPEHISNPNFYLNFIESSINMMSQNNTVEDIAKSND